MRRDTWWGKQEIMCSEDVYAFPFLPAAVANQGQRKPCYLCACTLPLVDDRVVLSPWSTPSLLVIQGRARQLELFSVAVSLLSPGGRLDGSRESGNADSNETMYCKNRK
ncbi:unnamed protein product, partial [Ectocarpus fasciculatus]